MKKLLPILLSIIPLQAVSSTECESNPLILQVNQITELKGQLFVALHTSETSYLKDDEEPFRATTVVVMNKGSQQLSLCDVPAGDYVISIYHDENDNNELDTGFFGIPKEPYGFSNNLDRMRPPSFEEATFHFDTNSLVEINLR
ncbi:MAG: DUF2141 domain-containing protein [bacterium]|nr:DUF2141 domain-containing protein [Gammaproteobacteria bacterium]HIL97866.1 DUF2141 domain-containing protein [Pseudomonadales bacterium]